MFSCVDWPLVAFYDNHGINKVSDTENIKNIAFVKVIFILNKVALIFCRYIYYIPLHNDKNNV